MPPAEEGRISAAVEGSVDEAVLWRLVHYSGGTLGPVYGKNGKQSLLQRLDGYNQAARYRPWTVVIDLDEDAPCAPPYKMEILPSPSPRMCFRIAVREVEAWILADRRRVAHFLGVPTSAVPLEPEILVNPKRTIVNLARRSRRRAIREDLVPREGSGREVGPAYTSRLIEFVFDTESGWRPRVAAGAARSLRGYIQCLRRLTSRGRA
jgi:hypothetical protein